MVIQVHQCIGWISGTDTYNSTTGLSTSSTLYIGTDSANKGEYIKIYLPVLINLTSVKLHGRQLLGGWEKRWPL